MPGVGKEAHDGAADVPGRAGDPDDGLVHGGGDNAAFVRRMAELIEDPAWNVDYHGFWDDPDHGGTGVFDPDRGRAVPVPEARAAFLEAFGDTRP